MTKLSFIILYIWSALAFAAATRSDLNKFHGEWIKLGLRIAQHPLPLDVTHILLAFDPDGRWLHMASLTA